MKNETYGIEFTAITDKFKAKIKEMASSIKQFGKETENNIEISPEIDLKQLQKWREEVKKLIDTTKENMEPFKGTTTEGKWQEDLKWYQDNLKAIDTRIEELSQSDEEFNNEAEKTKSILGEMFDKSIGKIKRFTYYLLGARSVFSLFMKYQSIYYQYNEQMQYQSELSQNAIALSLAPAFELLGNIITYTSIAFAKFIELLTGVPVLTKVTTKGIRDYNKSLKESQSLASGLDEITNLSLPSGTGLASQYKALDNFQKKVAEVEKFFKDNKWINTLIKGLQKIWDFLSKKIAPAVVNAFRYIVDNWDKLKYLFIGLGATALMFKIGMSLTGVSTALGASTMAGVASGTGLIGVAGVMKYLTGLGLIAIGVGITVTGAIAISNMLSEIKQLNSQAHDMAKVRLDGWVDVFDVVIDRINKTKKGTKEWDEQTAMLKEATKSVMQNIVNGKLSYDEYGPVIDEIREKLKKIDDEDFKAQIDLMLNTTGAEKDYAKFKAQIEKGVNVNLSVGGGGSSSSGGGGFSGGGTRDNLNSKVNYNSDYKVTNSPLNTKTTQTKSTNLWDGIKKVFGFARGLDYVPYDEYPAILHKGEAVVPAKYNPTIHSAGNEYTNSLLETLVVKMDDLSRRPNVFEIDGQQFANATYGLYEEASNNQNYVKGVVK